MHRLAAILCLLITACSSEPESRKPTCVEGTSQPCACADGTMGAQTCTSLGRFDACECASDMGQVVDLGAASDQGVPMVDMTGADRGLGDTGIDVGAVDMTPDVSFVDASTGDMAMPADAADTGPDMVLADLQVVAVRPADGELNVAVDDVMTVRFDGLIDPGSVTGRISLTGPGGLVNATTSVNGDTVVLTPDSALEEFQTPYTISVLPGVTSGGRVYQGSLTSSFTTRMFVADTFYAASSEFHGVGFSLAIDNANQCVLLPADDTSPNQRFRFVPRNGTWLGYNSAAIAAGRALDGGAGLTQCSMTPLGANPAPSQLWEFANQPSGTFQVHNQRFGVAQGLDSTSLPAAQSASPTCVPGVVACPIMQPTASVNQQFWRWRRLP